MTPKEAAEVLRRNADNLDKLDGVTFGGAAVIIPPEGEPIEFVIGGSGTNFLKYCVEQLTALTRPQR